MMKYTTIKQIGCLILATALLVSAGGCTVRLETSGFNSYHAGSTTFEVDSALTHVGWHTLVEKEQEKIILSFVTLQHPYSGPKKTTSHRGVHWGDVPEETLPLDGKKIVAKTETLYFIRDNRIILEKKYPELGIDASRLNADNKAVLDYLRPILEKMIRENVPPQETEMEEEEVEKKEQSAVIPLRFIPVFVGDDRTTNKSRNGA